MAVHKGSEGLVKIGANTVAEVKSYSIEESGDTVETTSLGDTARTYLPSLTTFSGTIECHWDETDSTGQGALTIGAQVTLNLYPEGDASGDSYYSGDVIVTGVSRSAAMDDIVAATYSFQGNGALTLTTV
jgi:hypothetical protein